MTTKELCEKFKITRMTAQQWIRDGCPHKKVKGRGRGGANEFDGEEVQAWLIEKGTVRSANRVMESVGSQEVPIPHPKKKKEEDPAELGILLERIRVAEKVNHGTWVKSIQQKATPTVIKVNQTAWLDSVTIRQRLEEKVPEIMAAQGTYRSVVDVNRDLCAACTIFRNSVLGVVAEIRGDLNAIIEDEDACFAVADLLDSKMRLILDRIASDIDKIMEGDEG